MFIYFHYWNDMFLWKFKLFSNDQCWELFFCIFFQNEHGCVFETCQVIEVPSNLWNIYCIKIEIYRLFRNFIKLIFFIRTYMKCILDLQLDLEQNELVDSNCLHWLMEPIQSLFANIFDGLHWPFRAHLFGCFVFCHILTQKFQRIRHIVISFSNT